MGSGRSLERSLDFAQDDMIRCVSVVATRTCPNSALECSVVVLGRPQWSYATPRTPGPCRAGRAPAFNRAWSRRGSGPARVCLVSRRAGAPAAGNGAQAAEGEEGEAGRVRDRGPGPELEAVKVHEIIAGDCCRLSTPCGRNQRVQGRTERVQCGSRAKVPAQATQTAHTGAVRGLGRR